MSGELLFELIEKAQCSFERKIRSIDKDKSWPFTTTFKKWFSSSIKLSPNAERFLQQSGEKSSLISLHIPSNRLALIVNNNIYIISLITSETLLEIPLDVSRSDEYNYLNCLTWSNNGKLLVYGHWSGILNRGEDSFVEIWFSGSDASQFIDLLCLKRTVWKIVDTNPSIIKIKEIIDEENNQVYIYGLALSPDESCLVAILSDQSIVLYQNNDYLRCLSKLKINENRPFICDFDYWDDKTLILFYSDGSMRQLRAHLTQIQSRLHVLQLSTTLLYPTFDEQLELVTRKQLFDNLFYSDQPFSQSIHDENFNLKDVQEKQIALNIPQKQILLYRRKLLDKKRKLYLYDNLMKICKIFQQYQSNIFDKFRE